MNMRERSQNNSDPALSWALMKTSHAEAMRLCLQQKSSLLNNHC